jgi:hypothetical protein
MPLHRSITQEKEYIAIIPALHDRVNMSGIKGFLRLERQQYVQAKKMVLLK